MEEKEKTLSPAALRRGYLYCIFAGAAWGFSGVCGQFLFDQRLWSVDFIIPLRMLLAGAVMLLVAAGVEGRAGFFSPFSTRRNGIDLLIFAILGLGLCQYSYYTTIREANATTATILCYLGPVLIIVWQALRARRLPAKNELLAVALAVLGTFVLTTHGDPTSLVLSPQALFWGLVSAFATAVYSIQPRGLTARCGTLTSAGWGLVLAGVFLCLVRRPWAHAEGTFDAAAWCAFITIVLVGSVVCFALYFLGVGLIGPTKASILSATEPLVSTLLSVFWLHVAFLPMDYVGFALVVSTIFILALPGKQLKNGGADPAPPAPEELSH